MKSELDLEKLTDIIVKIEYPNVEKFSYLEQGAIFLYRATVKKILQDHIKSATQGLLQDIEELSDWYPDYQDTLISISDVKKLIKKWFAGV